MAERKPARLEEYRPVRRAPDDYDEPIGEEDDGGLEESGEDAEYDDALDAASTDAQPDVLLDVPVLRVEEINLEVEDLNARVSLQAEVLSLLKLHVGADVSLGRVSLEIKGVDAVAQLKVRLDKVAAVIDRVMTTIDNNPEILTDLTSGLGGAVAEVGRGAGEALEEVGEGAGSAVESVGGGVEEAVSDLGQATGDAVEEVINDTGDIADDVLRPSRGAAERPRRERRQGSPATASSQSRDREPRPVRRSRPE